MTAAKSDPTSLKNSSPSEIWNGCLSFTAHITRNILLTIKDYQENKNDGCYTI